MPLKLSKFSPLVPVLPLVGIVAVAGWTRNPHTSAAASTPMPKAATAAGAAAFAHDVLPTVRKYCVSCHAGKEAAGGIDLTRDQNVTAMLAHRDRWERVAANVDNKSMPPAGSPAPTDAERAHLVDFVQSTIAKADCVLNDPGRVTVRRLNRTEYDNTIRDLTGLDLKLSADFPSDDVGYGFDNIGDVLSLSPLLMDKYLAAAEKIAHAAIDAPEDRKLRDAANRQGKTIEGPKLSGVGGAYADSGYILSSNGEAYFDYAFPAPGRYRFRVGAWEQHAGADSVQMAIRFEGATLDTVTVAAREKKPGAFTVTINVPSKGTHRVSIAFLNDYYDDKSTDPTVRGDRNLVINSFRLSPTDSVVFPPEPPTPQRLIPILPTAPTEAARAIATRKNIAAFALRAYRRPPTPAEIDRLCAVAQVARREGGSFEAGMQYAVEAALVSPNFLFRFERDPAGLDKNAKRLLGDYELATRLSYFLWSTMPDDRLLDLAARGRLHDPVILKAEAHRMMADPRSRALADNFAAQWLTLRRLDIAAPDPQMFPDWNDKLRQSMRDETLLFFNGIVRSDRSVLEFLDADYTYLNEPLAKLYGNPTVKGDAFQRVTLRGDERGGLLTQASVLTVTSNPTRTSPVKRGKWVMENLLGISIPAPPPGVGQLPDDTHGPITGTLRQRMEEHRKNPACASCHAQMDPIGFGLENYDAIGHWRSIDDKTAIDASGKLPTAHGAGQPFTTPAQMRVALRGRAPQFVHTLSEKLLTYALGRGVESTDRCNVDAIAANVATHNYKFSALVDAIVTSDPFRQRRQESVAAPTKRVANR